MKNVIKRRKYFLCRGSAVISIASFAMFDLINFMIRLAYRRLPGCVEKTNHCSWRSGGRKQKADEGEKKLSAFDTTVTQVSTRNVN
jgi:hypothetical protein